jgi:hypothetical protein
LGIDFYSIIPAINGRRTIVPFAQVFGVFGAKVLLPPLGQKLRMRRSNEQRLRVGLCKQLTSLSGRGAEDGIDDRPLLMRGYGNGLMHGCVLRRFE